MKITAFLSVIVLGSFSGAALAQQATAAQPAAPSSDHAAAVQAAEKEGLSRHVIEKLNARQIHDILRRKEAARTKIQGGAETIVVPTVFFACLVMVIGGTLYYRFRRDAQRHETIRLMVEKGAEIPPQLLVTRKRQGSDLKRGILLLAAGAGLSTFLAIVSKQDPAWSLGLVPAFIGAGYLLTWKLQSQRGRDGAAGSEDNGS